MKKRSAEQTYARAVQLLTCEERLPAEDQARGPAATIGRLTMLPDRGEPLVDFPANHTGLLVAARSTVQLSPGYAGAEVALVFEDGDLTRPIILGVVKSALPSARSEARRLEARIDGETVALTASKELVLRCGRASITLTAAGKLLLQGEYVVSRSAGVNKLRGASVQIN